MAEKDGDFGERLAGSVPVLGVEDEGHVDVTHVWHEDKDRDPGHVGLAIHLHEVDPELPEQFVSTLITAEDALVLAEHLRRVAGWIFEQFEDAPDYEREATKYEWQRQAGPEPGP